MEANKILVTLEDGSKVLFVEKKGAKGVRFYDNNDKALTAMYELVRLDEIKIDQKLKFKYADIEASYEYESRANVSKIEEK